MAPEASVRSFYYARSFHWRGAFGVSELAFWQSKKNGSSYQILGDQAGGCSVIIHRWMSIGRPGFYWYGEKNPSCSEKFPGLMSEGHSEIRDAARIIPFVWNYRVRPGPNSNTFISHLIAPWGIFLRPASHANWQKIILSMDHLFEIFETTPAGNFQSGLLSFILPGREGASKSLTGVPTEILLAWNRGGF